VWDARRQSVVDREGYTYDSKDDAAAISGALAAIDANRASDDPMIAGASLHVLCTATPKNWCELAALEQADAIRWMAARGGAKAAFAAILGSWRLYPSHAKREERYALGVSTHDHSRFPDAWFREIAPALDELARVLAAAPQEDYDAVVAIADRTASDA